MKSRNVITRIAAGVLALGMSIAMIGCGNDNPATASAKASGIPLLEGVKLKGYDKKGVPQLEFKKPLKISQNSIATLEQGKGAAVKDGQRLCFYSDVVNARTGKSVSETFSTKKLDCTVKVTKQISSEYRKLFLSAKIGDMWAMGIPGSSSGSQTSSANSDDAYISIMKLISAEKDLTRAEGDKVSDIPADLPKVTLAKDGMPSIDMNGYKGSDKLVVQPLIKGKGAKVSQHAVVSVNYTGWLLNGKEFDSSWTRGQSAEFSLDQVVKGWSQGLAGQTVGSQVLLVVPPSLGYGDQASGKIPANSTLVFVVDILAAN